jgi:hypothetical protein
MFTELILEAVPVWIVKELLTTVVAPNADNTK